MTAHVNLQITFEALVGAISSLHLDEKQVLEAQLFEQAAAYDDDAETVREIQAVKAEYAAGGYTTFDEFSARL